MKPGKTNQIFNDCSCNVFEPAGRISRKQRPNPTYGYVLHNYETKVIAKHIQICLSKQRNTIKYSETICSKNNRFKQKYWLFSKEHNKQITVYIRFTVNKNHGNIR